MSATTVKVHWLSYEFEAHKPPVDWNAVPGIYIFAGHYTPDMWVAQYVGQTDSFARRLPNHDRWAEAVRRGATHIHVMVLRSPRDRDRIEAEMIRHLQPSLNDQLK
jgi:hypothetical protein